MRKIGYYIMLLYLYIPILSYYELFLYFNLCLSVILNIISCSFTSLSLLTILTIYTVELV